MAFRNIVIVSPCKLSYKGGYLVVRKEDDTTKVHLSEITSIVLQTNQVYVSAYLLAELAKEKISFVVADEKCNPIGHYLPLYGSHNTSKRISEQVEWGEPIKKRVWQRVVKDKIMHQSRLLNVRACENEGSMLAQLVPEVRSGDTTNREAHAARIYFQALFGQGFSRDDDTPVNAALNYGYSILLSLSRCIFEPLIECLWMQCRFWRAGLPTWHVRALLLVKESGNLPHSGEAADKLDEAGPWAVPRISSRRLRSRVR